MASSFRFTFTADKRKRKSLSSSSFRCADPLLFAWALTGAGLPHSAVLGQPSSQVHKPVGQHFLPMRYDYDWQIQGPHRNYILDHMPNSF